MGKTDSLITGAHRAAKGSGGSYKTKHNHIREAERFVKTLRELGYGVTQWKNVTNKHIGAVVDRWKLEGLKTSTIKEYLSGVRVCSNFYGSRISGNNSDFKIENRTYISNMDKSVPGETFDKIIKELKESSNIDHNRVASQLELQRYLGLRKEESFKFKPERAVLKDARIRVSDGTKGGRERILNEISDNAHKAIEYAKSLTDGGNTMSKNMSEKQWEGQYYRILKEYGMTKEKCGASSHGNRHAFAQERYQQLTGFAAPCKFETSEDFRENAEKISGEVWKKLDSDARLILKAELGHGPDRDDVVSQYLGSKNF